MKLSLASRVLASSALALSLALPLGVVAGCSGSVPHDSTAASESAATRAPVAPNAHGPTKIVAAALSDVPLRAEQRTEIEKLAADADARHAAGQKARTDLMNAIAAQVEAGTIDRAALAPQMDAATKAFEASRPADRAALERLHAILDAGQRQAFVDSLKAKMHEGKAKHEGKARMEALATDLKLTSDQRDQIRGVVKDAMMSHHGEWKHHGQRPGAMLDAFASDSFTMNEAAPPVDAKAFGDRMLDVIEKVLPILTPEQRAIAAAKIREHAASGDDGAPMAP